MMMKRLRFLSITLATVSMIFALLSIPLLNGRAISAVGYEPYLLRQSGESAGQNQYTIMKPSPETLQRWVEAYNRAPKAQIDIKTFQVPSPRGSLSLLDRLQYTPSERDQGSCGNCWAWAGTGVMEVALDVQNSIKDRLSMQYLNSNYNGGSSDNWACCGGDLADFVSFYTSKGQAIPWSNTNAQWQDGSRTCALGTSVPAGNIATTPEYAIASIAEQTITTHAVGQATAIANIKNILSQNKAVWFAFYLATDADWNNFFSFWSNQPESTIWNPDSYCSHTADSGLGGHAVLCVGYNDDDPQNSYWIMVNSWGTTASRPNGIFRLDMNMNYDCYFRLPPNYYSFYWETLGITYNVWESYSDSNHQTQCNLFANPTTEHIAYMYGTGFTASHPYRVAYYDGSNNNVATEDKGSDSSGNLLSEHTFKETSPDDAPGTWHVIICEVNKNPPSTYNSGWPNTLASDNFTVQESAIPEFPTVWAVIVALALSFGVYLWLRRRMSPVRA
jgi:hypothetical protein